MKLMKCPVGTRRWFGILWLFSFACLFKACRSSQTHTHHSLSLDKTPTSFMSMKQDPKYHPCKPNFVVNHP
ncbi:hypothetical protein QBC42DRAFT_4259 [Cladorrhinum samala]|uniref:Secreted protein n=1 Tax=Cladorrhinum samala TaxID=585594 RepID=A0AAV9HIU9_9PEZI|nr:hypothetical protein QBC42DRAFT_4259 [Cladorrhinum samala]